MVDVPQRGRHVARGDPQGEALHHGRLAHARLAGQDRIVLAAAGEDVDDLADFSVAAQHGIDVAAAGPRVRSIVNWSRLGVLVGPKGLPVPRRGIAAGGNGGRFFARLRWTQR